MTGKLQNMSPDWVDPDDAPELTAEFFEKGTPMIGGREVTWEQYRNAAKDSATDSPPCDQSQIAFVFRVDADILRAFAATGDGWEGRMNDALREWTQAHLPSHLPP